MFGHLLLLIFSILGSISGFHTAGCSNTRSVSGLFTARWRRLRVLLGMFYSNAEIFRGLILSILGVLPSVLDVCTAGTACTRAYALLILQVLRVFRPPVLLSTLSTRSAKSTRCSEYTRSIEYHRSICGTLLRLERDAWSIVK